MPSYSAHIRLKDHPGDLHLHLYYNKKNSRKLIEKCNKTRYKNTIKLKHVIYFSQVLQLQLAYHFLLSKSSLVYPLLLG